MTDNRRQYPRFKCDVPVGFTSSQREDTSGALGRDISLGGAKITVNDFIPLGTILDMGVSLPGMVEQLVLKGKVKWIRENIYSEQFDIGVEFIADDRTKELIALYIKKQKV